MSVELVKDQEVNLTKEVPNLKRILIGLGWDTEKLLFTSKIDVTSSVICIYANGREENLIRFGRRLIDFDNHYFGAIKHYGDNLTEAGKGDDEQIEVQLDKVPTNISKIAVIININNASIYRGRGYPHFGRVKNCFVHVNDLDSGEELVRYNIDGNFDGKTGIFVADLYRNNGEWKFKAIGKGVVVDDIYEMIQLKCHRYRYLSYEMIERKCNK